MEGMVMISKSIAVPASVAEIRGNRLGGRGDGRGKGVFLMVNGA